LAQLSGIALDDPMLSSCVPSAPQEASLAPVRTARLDSIHVLAAAYLVRCVDRELADEYGEAPQDDAALESDLDRREGLDGGRVRTENLCRGLQRSQPVSPLSKAPRTIGSASPRNPRKPDRFLAELLPFLDSPPSA
jgi:hypothetical protein